MDSVTRDRALLLQRRYPEAIAAMMQAKQISSESSTVDFGPGQICLAQGDDAAITTLLVQASRRTPLIRVQLSSAYAGKGDRSTALAELEKAADRAPRG